MDERDLINILEKENELCCYLIEISNNITTEVKENNIKEVEKLVKAEVALAMKFSAYEKTRINFTNQLKKEKKYSGENFCITEIKKYVDKDIAEDLEIIEKKLKKSIEELNKYNQINNLLIKSKLDWIDFSLKTLCNTKETIYDSNKKQSDEIRLLDEII